MLASSASKAASGFLLLTIENCLLISSTGDPPDVRGTLSVVCVTLDVNENPFSPVNSTHSSTKIDPSSSESTRDVWLVLRVDKFEFPISPTQTIMQSRSKGTYTFVNAPGEKPRSLTLVMPSLTSSRPGHGVHLAEDLETLEVLLSQYGILQEIDRDEYGSDGDLKGRLVLVDQDDGEYVGILGNDIMITEDPFVEADGKNPVIVDVSEDGKRMNVHPVRAEDEDFLMKSAGFLSRGIVYAGDVISGGFSKASNYYVSTGQPHPEPIVFSETTRKNVKRLHTFSGQAVQVSSKTTGMIHSLIDSLASRVAGKAPPPSSKLTAGENGVRAVSPASPTKKPRFLNRVLLSTDMIITAVEQSVTTIVNSGTKNAADSIGHKYGKDAGDAAHSFSGTVKNVQVVYVDARGVGRRALLKRMGKGVVKAKFGKNEVVIGGEQNAEAPVMVGNTSTTSNRLAAPPALPPRSRSGSPAPPPTYERATGSRGFTGMAPPPLPPRDM